MSKLLENTNVKWGENTLNKSAVKSLIKTLNINVRTDNAGQFSILVNPNENIFISVALKSVEDYELRLLKLSPTIDYGERLLLSLHDTNGDPIKQKQVIGKAYYI